MDRIKIFDTTLRDGEQSPGCSMNLQEKLEVARCLEKLHVDVIEAGFAISGPQDFKSVQEISKVIKNAEVASLSRALEKDIDVAWDAVKDAVSPRIHTFIATSPLHMEYKLRMTPEKVLEQAGAMVAYAKKYCNNVEFSAEDATRSDLDFLVRITEIAIANGATVINLPDTVGYTTPAEMEYLIKYVMENAKGAEKAEFSVHCHNDLGMAVANSLAGVQGGARQIECTINGLGERATLLWRKSSWLCAPVRICMRRRPALTQSRSTMQAELSTISSARQHRSTNRSSARTRLPTSPASISTAFWRTKRHTRS